MALDDLEAWRQYIHKQENEWFSFFYSRIDSVGSALDCREGARGFDSWGRTNTQGLKITEKRR